MIIAMNDYRTRLFGWVGILVIVASGAIFAACESTPTLGCGCASHADCAEGWCDGCSCQPPCTTSEDCPERYPNCNTTNGQCFETCRNDAECYDPAAPICDTATGLCQGPCPGNPCPTQSPNCDTATGLCFGVCTADADCLDANEPVCNAETGRCQGPCPATACPATKPNCDTRAGEPSEGHCFGPCADNDSCVDPAAPVCNPTTGICQGPCPATACPTAAPNCDTRVGEPSEGECFGPCGQNADCVDTASPNCDPSTGICQGFCPATACPTAAPNCNDVSGLCEGPCTVAADCTDPAEPNCDPTPGICQGPCPATACPTEFPNCNAATGICMRTCDLDGCGDPLFPNCGVDGACFGPCAGHPDCTNPDYPNCALDSAMGTTGTCLSPCTQNGDCLSAAYPNCDTATGTCFPPCAFDTDCPTGLICEAVTQMCVPPACTTDAQCMPPTTVCEAGRCEPGCTQHSDCPADQRCRLSGANPNRCEPRDCMSDADCSPPATVCDTDGMADPTAGGYCVPGCTTWDDCPAGYDCNVATGACVPGSFGDIGNACTSALDCSNCASAFGTDGGTGSMVCTAFCCSQQDCPSGWACRPMPDGAGGSYTADVCVPLEAGNLGRRRNATCTADTDCRSGVCRSGACADSCCKDSECQASTPGCHVIRDKGTFCLNLPAATDLGALGCATPLTAPTTTCESGLCVYQRFYDQGCTTAADCAGISTSPYSDNWCGIFDDGYPTNDPGITDCIYDYCVTHCCSAADCGGSVTGAPFYCGKLHYSQVNVTTNVCRIDSDGTTGPGVAGDACTTGADCASSLCDTASNLCRTRCCTDSDCSNPAFPSCQIRDVGRNALMNVCVP